MPNRTPKPSRMTSPGYGFESATSPPGERFPWSRVEEVLASARNYWIATAGLVGRPQLRGAARRDRDPLAVRLLTLRAAPGRTRMRAATLSPSETGSRPVLIEISPVDGTFSSTVIA